MAKSTTVILTQDHPDLGAKGKAVHVRPGYARNYLFPRGLAVPATEARIRKAQRMQQELTQRMSRDREEAIQLKKVLEQKPWVLQRRAGREDLLFEAITRETISELLKEKGFTIHRRQVLLDQPVKRAGHYTIPIHLSGGIRAEIQLNVEPLSPNE